MAASDPDILVVGAGPAGTSAALAAARQGADVLVVERRRRVGLPVQCAEFIPAMLKGELELNSGCIVQKIKGMRTHVPGQTVQETASPGYIIHRDLFDQALAEAAREAGALIRCSTRAVTRMPNGDVMLVSRGRQPWRVTPKVIIGADGPKSTVGQWAEAANRHLLPGVQMTLPLAAPLDHCEIYFDPRIKAGYGWVFPKGEVANVGLGMLKPEPGQPGPTKMLDRFIRRLKKEGKIHGTPTARAGGWIPAEPLRNAVYKNILLAGDAAGHTHPVTGAGIFAAVACGEMAGKHAAAAVSANDMDLLKNYDHEWQDLFGHTLTLAHRRRKEMESGWGEELGTIVKKCWVAFREYYA